MVQTVKRLPTMWETWVQSLGQEDLLEKEMATHSSILAWKIPGQRNLVGYSPWGHKELDTTKQLHFLSMIYAFTSSLIHPLNDSFNYSFTHSFLQPSSHPLTLKLAFT